MNDGGEIISDFPRQAQILATNFWPTYLVNYQELGLKHSFSHFDKSSLVLNQLAQGIYISAISFIPSTSHLAQLQDNQ